MKSDESAQLEYDLKTLSLDVAAMQKDYKDRLAKLETN